MWGHRRSRQPGQRPNRLLSLAGLEKNDGQPHGLMQAVGLSVVLVGGAAPPSVTSSALSNCYP